MPHASLLIYLFESPLNTIALNTVINKCNSNRTLIPRNTTMARNSYWLYSCRAIAPKGYRDLKCDSNSYTFLYNFVLGKNVIRVTICL